MNPKRNSKWMQFSDNVAEVAGILALGIIRLRRRMLADQCVNDSKPLLNGEGR